MFDPDYDLFLAIVEAGSISAAARARGLTTAALSKRLARLELRLSTRLIHRTTRRLVLTPAGRDLHDSLLPLRTALLEAEERIGGGGGPPRGPLRITAPTSFGRMHLIPCLPAFMVAWPEVSLTVDLSDEFVDLLEGRCDLAIRIGAQGAAGLGKGLVAHRLGTSRRVLCAAPAYLDHFGAPKTLAELAGHRLLATTSQLPWQLDGPEGTVTLGGQSLVRTNSSEVVRELALGGCGIALRSLWDVGEALAAGTLHRILDDYEGSQDVGIFAVHAPLPAVPSRLRAMIDHLAAHFATIATLA